MTEMTETVTINKKALLELVRDSLELGELEAAGVDNWEGIDEVSRVTDNDVLEYATTLMQ